MPFLGFGKRKTLLKSEDVVQLTQDGMEKAEKMGMAGPTAQVMLQLKDGATQVRDIAESTRMPQDKVKEILQALMSKVWVRVVGTE